MRRFDPDPVVAEKKCSTLWTKLVFFFQHRGCSDPDDLTGEVFKRAYVKVTEGADTYAGMNAYCFGIAQFLLKEQWRRQPTTELPDEIPVPVSHAPNHLFRMEQTILLDQVLDRLGEDERTLLIRYFHEDRADLAAELGISPNSLRIRIHRILNKLGPRLAATAGGT